MPIPASPLTWWLTVSSVVVVGAAVAAVLFYYAGSGSPGPGSSPVTEQQASDEDGNAEQVEELVHHTRAAHEELVPVVEELDEVLPPDGSAPDTDAPATGDTDSWLETVREAAHHVDEVPSGQADFDITRTGLITAVDTLESAVVAYTSAQEAEDEQRPELLELAGNLRTQAVRGWSAAATQLDVVSTGADQGTVHLYLPAAPDSGALEPGGTEEGGQADADDSDHSHDH